MRLLIDAGNSYIKWAVEDGGGWMQSGISPVEQAGELPQQFANRNDIKEIWVSNVAGDEVAQQIRDIRAGHAGQPHFIFACETQCGVRNGYTSAGQLGSDRWAALVAAWHLVRGKCLVVNCGTATTIDTLSGQGEFLGGLILPGMELMQRSLIDATDQLKSGLIKPDQGEFAAFPKNTADAIYSGAIQASCGAIMQQYALMADDGVQIVISGGAAAAIQQHIKAPVRVVDDLVLKGLLLTAQEAGER